MGLIFLLTVFGIVTAAVCQRLGAPWARNAVLALTGAFVLALIVFLISVSGGGG